MFSASAPGSIMLLGEHAVLHGYPAVVGAIDRRIFTKLEPRKDNLIIIDSSILGRHETNINTLSIVKPFQFILKTLLDYKSFFPSGFDLYITSEFSDKLGLGSSAAVTVSTIAVLEQWLYGKIDLKEIYTKGINVIRSVQGMGSGSDVAASVFGGVLAYRPSPFEVESIPIIPEINLIYTGYKTPTPVVVGKVEKARHKQPLLFDELFANIGKCVEKGILAIKEQNWKQLGAIFLENQYYLKLLGVSDMISDNIVECCMELSAVLGAKISGSGLGDCIIALGKLPANYFPVNEEQKTQGVRQLAVQITDKGI